MIGKLQKGDHVRFVGSDRLEGMYERAGAIKQYERMIGFADKDLAMVRVDYGSNNNDDDNALIYLVEFNSGSYWWVTEDSVICPNEVD